MQKKTLLIGNFGSGNIGDELILNFSLEKYEKDDVVVMTNEKVFSQEFTEKQFETIPFFPTGVRSFFSFIFDKKAKKDFFVITFQCGESSVLRRGTVRDKISSGVFVVSGFSVDKVFLSSG